MNNKKVINRIQDLGALIALVLLVVVIGIISPDFRTVSNFLSLLRQSSINGFIAFGMTCVILTGGIDLSVGSTLALSTALCAGLIKGGMPVELALILALAIVLFVSMFMQTLEADTCTAFVMVSVLNGVGQTQTNKNIWKIV